MSRNEATREAIRAYLLLHGHTTTAELKALFGRDHTGSRFAALLKYMVKLGMVKNIRSTQNAAGIWAAAESLSSDAEEAQHEEPHIYPRYCLQAVAMPRQYDIRAAVYKPAPWAPPRG
jgi:hypothetical protein